MIRRKIKDIDKWVGRDTFELEVKRREFQMIANGYHLIVICDKAPIAIHPLNNLRRRLQAHDFFGKIVPCHPLP